MVAASASQRIAELLRAATVEVYETKARQTLDDFLPKGRDVYVSFLPGDDFRRRIEIATALRQAGYSPVPHVPARQMLNDSFLQDYIGGLVAAAQVDRLLIIAGDSSRPRGPYATALDIIESGVLQKNGIRFIHVAGHPEGNAGLAPDRLMQVLVDKRAAATRAGIGMGITTQFSFDPKPIADWLRAVQTAGLDVPIRIGLAGPANPATLLKFALRCGIGNSVSAVQKHVGTIGRLLKDTGPEGVVRGLADTLVGPTGATVANFHLYPFGGLGKTGNWLKTMLAEVEG